MNNLKSLDEITDKILIYKDDIPKALYEASLKIGNIELQCAVLDGEVRVISQRRLLEALGRKGRPKRQINRGFQLPDFLLSENLKPYINKDLIAASNYIEYQPLLKGRTAYGIKAEVLPMICAVFINAAADRALKKQQLATANICRVLQNGFAQVGIIALIDEATGYQDVRAKNVLAKILEEYLAKEIQKWTKTFPLEFYKEIYRLKGWVWIGGDTGKKPNTPDIVGKYTDDYVYRRLAPGVLTELKIRNPDRRVRHHQWFEPERGHPKLREHIHGVMAIMRVSQNWHDFREKMDTAYPLQWEEGTLFYKKTRSKFSN